MQGQPGRCNVYLIEDEASGITLFDAGARTMARSVAAAGARLGGISRMVLGHGHTDHRGIAPGSRPRARHPDEVQDAEAAAASATGRQGLAGPAHAAIARSTNCSTARLGRRPGEDRGHRQGGRRDRRLQVIDLPGHAPGHIGLWRESDRLALVTTASTRSTCWAAAALCILPAPTYNYDTEQARRSIRKLAEMEPAAAWPGYAKALTGDVRGQLLKAAGAAEAPGGETSAGIA